jgi:phosphotransferase system  glucose/maltose/N-acetylglucosamine-specific IIC component
MEFAPAAKLRHEHCITFAAFMFFSALLIGALLYWPPTFSKPRDWLVVAVAMCFPIVTVISFRACTRFGRRKR